MRSRSRAERVLIAAPAFRPWDLGTYVEGALRTLAVPSARVVVGGEAESVALSRAVREAGATAVIGLKLDGVSAGALEVVRRLGARVLLWQVDCFTNRVPRWMTPLVRAVDVVAVTARGMVPAYERIASGPVRWVMEGAYLPAFPAVNLAKGQRALYGSDVAFVGGLRQPPVANRALADRRRRLLARLAGAFRLKVWGPQRPAAIALARKSGIALMRWPAYNDELVRVCRASSIVLGINTINTVFQYFSNRTFLTLASGGFHVTHHVPGLEELFDNHVHLVWFRDDDECVDVCRHYLRRPDARARIAAAGRRRVRARWSLTRQVARLLDLLEVPYRA